jgi:two-component system sensor histidine kinase YesM
MDDQTQYKLTEEQLPAELNALVKVANVPTTIELYLNNLVEALVNPNDGRPYAILPLEQVRHEQWFIHYIEYPAMNAWMQTEPDSNSYDLCYLSGIMSLDESQIVGLVVIRLDSDELMDNSKSAFPDYCFIDVKSKNGYTILEVGTKPDDVMAMGLLVKRSPEDAFVVSAHFSEAMLYQGSQRMMRGVICFAVAYTCLLLALTIVYSVLMSRRVKRIAKIVNQYAQGDYGKRIMISERNELGPLVWSLNELMNSVEGLLQREYYDKLRQKQTELKMLQAQINPHFLYNILGSIGNLALLGDGKRVSTITRELALFYRMTFASGSGLISVRQEISQVSKYLDILKIQYQHRLDVVMEVDEAVYPFGTPRFILQPFVENAVNHSWQMTRLTLIIRASLSSNNVQLEVEEDGVGMDAETLHSIFRPSLERKHYGVTNVDERIKLQFGEGYGVSVTSQPMQGTRVIILMPQTRIESVMPHQKPTGT